MVGTPLVRESLTTVVPEPCREVGLQPLALAAHLWRRVVVLLDAGDLPPGLDVLLPLGVGKDGAFYAVGGCGLGGGGHGLRIRLSNLDAGECVCHALEDHCTISWRYFHRPALAPQPLASDESRSSSNKRFVN
ncbi:MAG: hypothetical protein BWY57_03225 [Betaproteobacteria bacterium ADurb.Bin341]|nr:MAG: hypothetical protein BWY57_03225 [Betaproteobacteria bacterium ADurb.Bin341]